MSKLYVDEIQPKTSGGEVTGVGKVLQCQTVTSDTDFTIPTGTNYQIPSQSTPTNTQGYTLLTKTVTPRSSTSVIIAQARLYFCEPINSDTGGHASMFKDSTLIGFIGNHLFVYSQFDSASYSNGECQTAIGDMQAVTSGHAAGTPVVFKCNVGSAYTSTSNSVRVNNGAGGSGLHKTSFAIPSSLVLWEVEQ